jgi:aminocarboxymuconate-semialdehyde decarboxylase
MANRRTFLKALASAAGSAGAIGRVGQPIEVGAQRPPGGRREVSIGSRRVKVIDVHAHCVVPEVAEIVAGTALAKSAPQGRANALGPERLQQMDQQGLDVQALSINGFWWYAADRALAEKIVRAHNTALAKWTAANPERFVAMNSVALQFPDLAAEQIEEGVKSFGLRGIAIGGHVNGEDLSLPKYDGFWAKAAALDQLVFMHPNGSENIVKPKVLAGRGDLGNIIGNPLETTYFLSRLIFDGTLDKFPGLRVCAAHAGGYLPSYLGRTDVACDVRGNANCANKKRPRDYFKRELFIDTMVFSEEGLRHLVAEVGVGQIVYGTDIPFNWPVTVDLVLNASFLSEADKTAILGGNLARLLRLAS